MAVRNELVGENSGLEVLRCSCVVVIYVKKGGNVKKEFEWSTNGHVGTIRGRE